MKVHDRLQNEGKIIKRICLMFINLKSKAFYNDVVMS